MPAKTIRVNLLGETELEFTPLGRIISWATTYGRYIMIGTEIVVLLAFISRFTLDRKLTDLKDEIEQKQELLEANADTTVYYQNLQAVFGSIKQILDKQQVPLAAINTLQTILPPDVFLQSYENTQGFIKISAVAGTTNGFSQFIANLSNNPDLSNIELGDIKKAPDSGIIFNVTAQLKNMLVQTKSK